MLKNRTFRGIVKTICRYSSDVKILRSQGHYYDKDTMMSISEGRKEIDSKMAIFKKSGLSGNSTTHNEDGKMIDFDVKIMSTHPLVYTEEQNNQTDVILWNDEEYILTFLNKIEDNCDPLYIAYAKTYQSHRTET